MRLLVYYDGSEVSERAVRWASNFSEGSDKEVFVANTITRVAPLDYHEIQQEREKIKIAVQRHFNGNRTNVAVRLLVDGLVAGEQLVRFARRNQFDALIVGVDRTSRLGKLLLGSLAQFVVLQAPCPVITVK